MIFNTSFFCVPHIANEINFHTVAGAAESCNPSAAKKGQRPLGGMGFQAAPPTIFPAVDVELKYSLQFGESFEPQKGGKLPGLMMAQAGNCKGGTQFDAIFSNLLAVLLRFR